MQKILILLLLPVICFSQQTYNYTNLVLEGGGIRGVAYAGVFSVLEERNILLQIEKVGGSSVGAIAGFMVSVGYTAAEIDSIMRNLPIQQFNDGKGGLIGKYQRVKKDYGLYEGQKFEEWLQQLGKKKTGKLNFTFAELHQLHLKDKKYKDLYCTATNLSRQQLEIFSFEHTPDMSVALAVRISSSIPLYFEPTALDNNKHKIKKGDTTTYANYYVDGGMLCNYPISMFDSCENKSNPLLCNPVKFNPQTIGIKLERPEQIDSLQNDNITIPPYDIDDFNDYLAAFSNLMIETLNRKYPNLENEKGRTIYVSCGHIQPKVRKMKPEEKKLLYDNGVTAALNFLK